MVKQFKQFKFQLETDVEWYEGYDPDNLNLLDQSNWSKNLLENNMTVMGLSIYALPGTRFQMNQLNAKEPKVFIMNNTGVFQIDTAERPITNLYIHHKDFNNGVKNFPIIIDIIYKEQGAIQ